VIERYGGVLIPARPRTAAGGPSAASITVLQTLALLDTRFSELAEGIAHRQYGIWLGSGISRERVDDLKAVINRVLLHLHGNADFADPNCAYRGALSEALDLAQLSSAEQAMFNPADAPAGWTTLPIILDRLTTKYARLLDIRLPGKRPDYLLWEVVDVPNTFAAPGLTPDCEHLALAILILEGAVSDIASANWDGLIERAVGELSNGDQNILRICVRPDDFRAPPLRSRLIKFHGCAVCAFSDPNTYRDLLIGRESQITSWPHDQSTAVMRQKLVSLVTTSPTLIIGLSAQDSNIKDVFVEGAATMGWAWPTHPPAYVFAENALGADQRTLLKCVYRAAYDNDPQPIEDSARLRAFAKPLLIAIVLDFLYRKLRAFAHAAVAPHLSLADRSVLEDGLRGLRDGVAAAADVDRLAFLRGLIEQSARGIDILREGRRGLAIGYRPLSVQPAHQIAGDPATPLSGLPEAAATLGLLGAGLAEGLWQIQPSAPADLTTGSLQVIPHGSAAPQRLFFVANAEAALKLQVDNIVGEDEPDAIILYSTRPPTRLRRSPRAAPGRTAAVLTREVGLRDLLNDAPSLADFKRRFREEAVL
jgi:hypothetical protein